MTARYASEQGKSRGETPRTTPTGSLLPAQCSDPQKCGQEGCQGCDEPVTSLVASSLLAAGESKGEGPYLVIVAMWQDTDDTDTIAEAVSTKKFPAPEGWPKGCVVAFRREVATGADFQRDLGRFDLRELKPNV